jgi:hypothetical protein
MNLEMMTHHLMKSAIIVSGTTDSLDFDKPYETIRNPTYEYYPPKSGGGWPRNLELLNWAHPFVLYPMVYQLPSGNVFVFVSNKTVIIDPKTDAITSPVQDITLADNKNRFPYIYPYTPTMMMLPLSKRNGYRAELLVCGGSYRENNQPLSSAECYRVAPDTGPPVAWTKEPEMPEGRVMPDSVILPDGTILIVNGAGWGLAGGDGGKTGSAGDPVFATSLYDPVKKVWTKLARAQVPRLYHSGAILLESGHVITMGSEMQNYIDTQGSNPRRECYPVGTQVCTDPYEYRIERFTPPYLLTGKDRPVIAKAPESLTYKSIFSIDLSSDLLIDKVSLIRYSTTTHSTNTDQRLVELEILSQVPGKLYLEAPPSGSVAPPGNWMLFILAEGVPSVAKTIQLKNGEPTLEDVPIPEPLPKSRATQNAAGVNQKPSYLRSIIFPILIIVFLKVAFI